MSFIQWVLGFVLASMGLVITYMQARQREQEHKFKLYEKRKDVLIEFEKFSAMFMVTGEADKEERFKFYEATRGDRLLFSQKVRDLIKQVEKEVGLRTDAGKKASSKETKKSERAEWADRSLQHFRNAVNLIVELQEAMEKETAPADSLAPEWFLMLAKWTSRQTATVHQKARAWRKGRRGKG